MNYGEALNPVDFTIMHAAQSCTHKYFTFFQAPVQFDASHNSLTLPTAVIDERLPIGNPHLATLNDLVVRQYLAHLDSSDLQEQVKGYIIDELPSGRATDAAVSGPYRASFFRPVRLRRVGRSFAVDARLCLGRRALLFRAMPKRIELAGSCAKCTGGFEEFLRQGTGT